jgi:hypothetical protein
MLKEFAMNKFLQYCEKNKLNPRDYTPDEKLQIISDFIIQDSLKQRNFSEFNDFAIKYCKENKLDINNLTREQQFRIGYEFNDKKLDDYFE